MLDANMNIRELLDLPAAKLARIIALKAKIEKFESQLASLIADPLPVLRAKTAPKKRKMTAAARKKISLAQKARWAKQKASK
jgi:hypothetical protein